MKMKRKINHHFYDIHIVKVMFKHVSMIFSLCLLGQKLSYTALGYNREKMLPALHCLDILYSEEIVSYLVEPMSTVSTR